ncbi:MAG: hypothetical protein IPI72_09030 [Flavobacteriales bacterium]|nr:hypothetical protein [Flavobacteriales bacterium]
MMYLVLTALLALNVSKEILDSFVTVNNGLENTKLSLNDKDECPVCEFRSVRQREQCEIWCCLERGQEDQDRRLGLVAYVDSIKVKAIMKAEGLPFDSVVLGDGRIMDLAKVNKKDSHDELTNMMVGSEPGKPIEGPFTRARTSRQVGSVPGSR